VYVGLLGSKEVRRLLSVQSHATYTPPGYLLFVREGILLAQRFDPVTLRMMSDPVPVVPEPGSSATPVGSFSSSSNGVIAYHVAAQEMTVLQWFDRSGKRLESLGAPAHHNNVRISPDGRRVAVDAIDSGTGARDVWIIDSAARRQFRLSFTGSDWQPVWSHDGRQIAFSSFRNGPMNIFRKASDGTGVDHPLIKSDENTFTNDWSPDGRYLAYHVIRENTNQDLFVLPLEGDRRPTPIATTRAIEVLGRFSPDSRFIAYTSNETGRDEVYLQPVPPTGAKWQISVDGGSRPVWRGDGRELFYLTRDLKVAAVNVRLDAQVEVGAPQPLFEVDDAALGPGTTKYDVSRDGQRFLVNTRFARGATDRITVVLNWASGLQP
jgi:Tol biopolymer transport system component